MKIRQKSWFSVPGVQLPIPESPEGKRRISRDWYYCKVLGMWILTDHTNLVNAMRMRIPPSFNVDPVILLLLPSPTTIVFQPLGVRGSNKLGMEWDSRPTILHAFYLAVLMTWISDSMDGYINSTVGLSFWVLLCLCHCQLCMLFFCLHSIVSFWVDDWLFTWGGENWVVCVVFFNVVRSI
jgi:hypothetical protein